MSRADIQVQLHAFEHAPDGFNTRSPFSADRQTERVYFVLQDRGDPLGAGYENSIFYDKSFLLFFQIVTIPDVSPL